MTQYTHSPISGLRKKFDGTTGALVDIVDKNGDSAWPAVTSLVSEAGKLTIPNGLYLGSSFPKRLRAGGYGRKIASWGALQNQAGTNAIGTPASFGLASTVFPWMDNATNILKLTQNATASFGQQKPFDGGQPYMPRGGTATATAGVWVYNPTSRTLNFELRLFNGAANHSIYWNCAVEPCTDGVAKFLTMTAANASLQSWVHGTDVPTYCRVSQLDTSVEGAWQAGEVLYIGNVYLEPKTRARFCITFDDGVSTQRNPGGTSIVSGTAYASSVASNVLAFNAAPSPALIVGQQFVFTDTAPTGASVGTVYYVKTVPDATHATLATDAVLTTTLTMTDGSGTWNWQYGGTQERSGQQIVESYGFRGSLFIVPQWLGTSSIYGNPATSFMSAADVLAMWRDGWAVGSHSMTHPSNNENAGLRLLGPYGYYLSNPADNLPAQYLTNFSLTGVRRRATSATQASPSVVTFESAHKFLINQPIVWTDVAPTGFTVGVTYYVATAPSSTTATFATDQGTLVSTVNNTTGAWAGTANYRHPGSANDDSAIYADVVACGNALLALGITTAFTFFALPQGGWDQHVRSALVRAGFRWVRGTAGATGTGFHTVPLGLPTGGGMTMIPGGWMAQPDALQTDATFTNLATVDTYVSDGIAMGACMCNYHHGIGVSTLIALDRLCQTLQTQQKAGNVDVLTLDELAKEQGIA